MKTQLEGNKNLNIINQMTAGLTKTIDTICLVNFLILTVLVTSNVLARYLSLPSISWVDEGIQFTTIWMVFLGTFVLYYKKQHISAYVNGLEGKWVGLVVISEICMIAVNIVVVIGGWQLSMDALAQIAPITRLPKTYWYIAIPISSAFIVILSSLRLYTLMINAIRKQSN